MASKLSTCTRVPNYVARGSICVANAHVAGVLIVYKIYTSYNIIQKDYCCVGKHVWAGGQGAEFEFPLLLPISFNLSPNTDRWDPPIRHQQGNLC